MVRVVLFVILIILIARAFWRVVDNVIEAATGRPSGGRGASAGQIPTHGAKMVRDPVCGTFVLPDRAVSIADGRGRVYFCSDACRDAFRARTA